MPRRFSSFKAFSVTNRYTGQQLDDDTGLYFYNSRYYDPELARFVQADTIVPSADTSQALNRYAYVKNNPLKFTDPSGHGWFSKFMKKWIGTILTVVFAMAGMPFLGALISSAVSTVVNGGNWKSFAIGLGIGLAAGLVAGPISSWIGSGLKLTAGGLAQAALRGALAGALAGGATSAVYGQNVGKGMLEGAGTGAVTASAVWGVEEVKVQDFTKGHFITSQMAHF